MIQTKRWPLSQGGLIISILLMTLLTGCGATKKASLSARGHSLAQIKHWQVQARISVITSEDNVAATLDWTTHEQDFDFHVYGTFGITYAHLTQNGHSAKLALPDEQTFYHQDAEQLLYQSLGWDFPLKALSYWIKGLPSNLAGEQVYLNEIGQLKTVALNGWQVEFSRYQDYLGFKMPKMIKAKHPQMKLKIVIRDWEFFPQSS
ncbi:lipoprotein insertase outer membrane protein LolB [Aliikangiella sp. IMCC44653]